MTTKGQTLGMAGFHAKAARAFLQYGQGDNAKMAADMASRMIAPLERMLAALDAKPATPKADAENVRFFGVTIRQGIVNRIAEIKSL